jgi:hypothetical protein
VREEPGLRLEPTREPVDIIVIFRAEKASSDRLNSERLPISFLACGECSHATSM